MIKERTINEGPSSSEYVLEIFNLTKIYKLKGERKFLTALNNINLKIKKGEIFGLLGPNGAGKTTLISILTTLKQPTSGYATLFGHNILKEAWFVKENVGLMFGADMLYHRLTGYRNLKFFCKIYGIKDYKSKINRITEELNLNEWLNQFVSNYSKGMRLKLALARVLLIDPKFLFLDEPMLGLDPATVKEVISIFKNLKIPIFLTSHQMDVVSRLCDRITFLKEGKIIKIDTKKNLKKLISEKIKIQVAISRDKDELIKNLKKFDYISEIKEIKNQILFYIEDENYFSNLFDLLKDYHIISFNEIRPTLEDVFIKLST